MISLIKSDEDLLINYLESVQSDFNPPLFQRINVKSDVKTIEDYAAKLLRNANVYAISGVTRDDIHGIIAIYTNNVDTLKAYIPILSVKKEYSGKGLAHKLIRSAEDCAFKNGMKTIDVKTWPDNKKAISLYEKCGFTQILRDDLNIYLRKQIR